MKKATNKLKIFYLILFMSIYAYNFAQIDTNYINVFKNKISLGGKIGALNNNFILKNDSNSYNLNSNIVPTFTLWFKYKKLPTIAILIPVSVFTPDTLAKTKGIAIDLKGQIAKGFILDGYFFFERGFNLQDRSNFRDIKPMFSTYNVNGNLELFYIFNFKKLSYKNPYLFGEIQKKSAGSFMLGTSVGFFKLHNEYSFFKDISDYNRDLNFKDVSTITLSISGSYIHTLVFGKSKKWFVNGALTVGPSLNIGNTTYFDVAEKEKILKLGLNTKYKFAIGHNFKKWNLSLTSKGDFVTFRPSERTILNSNVIDVKFSTIYKF